MKQLSNLRIYVGTTLVPRHAHIDICNVSQFIITRQWLCTDCTGPENNIFLHYEKSDLNDLEMLQYLEHIPHVENIKTFSNFESFGKSYLNVVREKL